MSTGVIIAIVVVVLILLALLFLLPRMRAKSNERKAQRELESRRERVATEHRETASERAGEAERAEQEAEIAQQKARAQRAEAEKHEAEAKMHERGLADDKLVDENERDRFAGVSGTTGTTDADRTHDSAHAADRDEPAARRATADDEPVEQQHATTAYEQGREDERVEEGRTPRT